MKRLLFFCFLFQTTLIFAQGTFMADINGRPLTELKYTDIEGTPYLNPDWSVCVVKATNGKNYDLTKARFNIYTNELEYEKNGKLLVLSLEITEFSLNEGLFRKNFPATDGRSGLAFYNVLYDGNTKLLRYISVKTVAERAYSSATETKRFEHNEVYYVLINNELRKIKKDKKSILEVLASKKEQVEKFIKDQKLKCSTIDDLVKILAFYEGV